MATEADNLLVLDSDSSNEKPLTDTQAYALFAHLKPTIDSLPSYEEIQRMESP